MPTLLPKKKTKRLFLVGLILTLAYCVWLLHPLGTGTTRIQGNVDTYLHAWNLWWVYQSLIVEGSSPYFTTYSGYPEGTHLLYHSLILPLGLLSLPLFAPGLPASQVYLFYLYMFPVAGYTGMFLLANRLRAPPLGALASGLYFVLTPVYWNHLSHPDQFCFLLFPWLVLSVLQLRNRPFTRIVLPGLLGACLFLMSPYYAAGLMVL